MSCLTKLDEPFFLLASFCWAFFSFFSVLMRNLRFSNDASLDRTAYLFSPTSMPTARFLSISFGNTCLSSQNIAYQRLPCHIRKRKRHSDVSCRSEEHTSELQSRGHLVCRLLLEKKKQKNKQEDK